MKEKKIGYLAPQYYRENIQPGYPDELDGLIKEFAMKASETPQPWFYVKGAVLYYSYDDKAYCIYPQMLNCTGEVLSVLSNEMIDNLYGSGAYEMFYAGMID